LLFLKIFTYKKRCNDGRANTANACAMVSSSQAAKSGYLTDHFSINLSPRFQVWVTGSPPVDGSKYVSGSKFMSLAYALQKAGQEGNGRWMNFRRLFKTKTAHPEW